MGRLELLLLASAILVFEFFTLTLTEMQLEIKLNNIEEKLDNYAISEAKSFLEDLEVYAFDENLNSDNSMPTGFIMPISLTAHDSLGLEDSTSIDDIDDFIRVNEFRKLEIDGTSYFEYFLTCDIYYVDDNLNKVNAKTSKKRADITITNDFLDHSVQFSRIFSYYWNLFIILLN